MSNEDEKKKIEDVESIDQAYQKKLEEYEKEIKKIKEDYKQELGIYKTELKQVITKSNELFEKQLVYVAAGTIAVSAYIAEKFLKDVPNQFNLLLFCWASCGLAIILNMISHYINMIILPKTLDELSKDNFNENNANDRRRCSNIINFATILLYGIGLLFFTTYITLNFENMNRENKSISNNKSTKGIPVSVAPIKPIMPPPPPPPKVKER